MSDHIDIFNLIYSIKEKISDNDFLELNNKIQKLIQENNELRKEKNSSGKIIQIFSRESESIQYRYVSDESEEYFSEENISEEEDFLEEDIPRIIPERHQCECSRKWIFPNLVQIDGEYSDYFCLESEERMRACENFRKLIETFPLLENLFNKIDLPFVEEVIENVCVTVKVTLYIRVFLSLISQIRTKKNKILITFVMYDCMIRNINFLRSNVRLSRSVLSKFEEFLQDQEYVDYSREYNINCEKWLEILRNV